MEREDDVFDYKLMKKELKQAMREQKKELKESSKIMKDQMKQNAKQLKQELKQNKKNMLNSQEQFIDSQHNFQYQMMQDQQQLQQQILFNQQQMHMQMVQEQQQMAQYIPQNLQNSFQYQYNQQNRQFPSNNQYQNFNYPPNNYNQNFYQGNQQNFQQTQVQNDVNRKAHGNKENNRKSNLKIIQSNTQQLFEDIFNNDKQKVQLCIQNQDQLAATLRKDKNGCLKQLYKKEYQKQIEYLKQNGFGNTSKIIVLLKEENGNEEIVLRKLIKETIQKQLQRQMYQNEINIIQKNYKHKICKHLIIKHLKEADGDVQKALLLINLNKQTCLNDQQVFKEQLQTLALEGWLSSATLKKIIQILKKNSGDLDKSRFEIQLLCHHKIKQITYSEIQSLNDFNITENFNEKFTDVVIDGNNLLFMNSSIRKNCINKQRAIAEQKIFQLSFHLKEILGLRTLILIFDQMHTKICDSKIQVINCKNTQFKSSDDFIVDHVMCLNDNQARSSLIITSDNELTYRIFTSNRNISVMKGKTFFEQIEQLISQQIFNDIVTNDQI
ncbi:hypothetical protein TTHERM_00529630 (macronuclear) [Tetrahymena thermophila SB210]|uniref:Uncharacterized protein n=1 Tax=Tetrahymena thermophila (strain SB210) TaxID=312017 RepID=I7MGC0_TETTS|nr:hypothetical protein TTHERM_00529630 [Tetrahymena thermophila SB210]EAR85011.3 hypothetical protein TTHERM_00529630 [Tetrahymena thermophila SB210]|eukprot:XP_001032674.3 hypothetical protein TTHERM_00529630 [Tetrahymena thermophila SB210]